MILDTIIEQTLDLLMHPEFKCFGDLQKHRYQMQMTDDEKFLRSDMYKGMIANVEAIKKGHQTRKKDPKYKEKLKKAAQKRAAWYNNPENKEKFMKKIKNRKFS